jgi:hypothetical protein
MRNANSWVGPASSPQSSAPKKTKASGVEFMQLIGADRTNAGTTLETGLDGEPCFFFYWPFIC